MSLTLDLERIEADTEADVARIKTIRQIKILDAQMRSKNVARIQRAVICMMVAHPDVISQEGGIRCVELSYSKAAAWCRANLECVRGLRLDKSAFRKALASLVQHGVLATTTGFLWLNTDNLREWFDLLPEPVKTPEFTGVSVGVQRCPTVSNGVLGVSVGVRGCPTVSGGESLNERMNESSIIHSEGNPSVRLDSLPPIPDEVWDADNTTFKRMLILRDWWLNNDLSDSLGEARHDTRHAMIALVEVAVKKGKNPAGYYAKASRNPAAYLVSSGKRIEKGMASRLASSPSAVASDTTALVLECA